MNIFSAGRRIAVVIAVIWAICSIALMSAGGGLKTLTLLIGFPVIWAVTWAVGWIVRGLLGIPSGKDKRPTADF